MDPRLRGDDAEGANFPGLATRTSDASTDDRKERVHKKTCRGPLRRGRTELNERFHDVPATTPGVDAERQRNRKDCAGAALLTVFPTDAMRFANDRKTIPRSFPAGPGKCCFAINGR